MIINVFSFTDKGRKLAERLRLALDMHEVRSMPDTASREEVCAAAFRNREALVFIGAAGIAVRSVAPFVRDKLEDPPVLVMDELGLHVIPVLSGHMGGANALALEIADATGASPVITTATDLNGAFPADVFAKENGLAVANRDGIAKVSSSALEGRPVTVCIKDYPPAGHVDVLITDREDAGALKDADNGQRGCGRAQRRGVDSALPEDICDRHGLPQRQTIRRTQGICGARAFGKRHRSEVCRVHSDHRYKEG